MMKSNQFLAGTALCLLMAAPLSAQAGAAKPAAPATSAHPPMILAQAEEPEGGQEGGAGADCPPGTSPAPGDGGCVSLEDAPAAPAEEPPAEEAAPEAEPPAEEPAPEAEPEVEQAEPEAAPADPEMEAPAEEAPAPEAEPAEPPAEAAPPAEEQPAEEVAPGEAQEETPPPAPAQEEVAPQAEEQPAEEEEPAEEAPAATDDQGTSDQPADQPATVDEEEAAPAEQAPAEDVTPEEAAPAGEAVPEEAPAEQATPEESPAEEVAPTEPTEPAPTDEAAPAEPGEEPAEPGTATEATPGAEEEVLPENAAPVLDSQKEDAAGAEQSLEGAAPAEEQAEQPTPEGEPVEQQAEEAPLPESDTQAQQNMVDPEQVQQELRAFVEEEGRRIDGAETPEQLRTVRREIFRPREEGRVVREFNDNRTIIEINNRVFIESPDYDRIVRRGDRVWYEELRGGRVREVVERGDGVRIITLRNRYGDVIRRVRVAPDGREYVLAYLPEDRFDAMLRFEDPARDLPPLRLRVPVDRYILEAEQVDDPQRYYAFLSQPPVEPVRRLYSIEEVRYSARVRDIMPRVDLSTIEFEFGSARIEESEIQDLEALADAMLELLERNPAETFLIEGHTDAVGSEMANLALSDRRADAVARALTDVFEIPPENLATQGYGEQYLKVNTQEPSRENRRVAVRRITPLVAPVASAR